MPGQVGWPRAELVQKVRDAGLPSAEGSVGRWPPAEARVLSQDCPGRPQACWHWACSSICLTPATRAICWWFSYCSSLASRYAPGPKGDPADGTINESSGMRWLACGWPCMPYLPRTTSISLPSASFGFLISGSLLANRVSGDSELCWTTCWRGCARTSVSRSPSGLPGLSCEPETPQ